jgi:hypothetical protein
MAAPYITGLAASITEKYPTLSVKHTFESILQSTRELFPNEKYGWGKVDRNLALGISNEINSEAIKSIEKKIHEFIK